MTGAQLREGWWDDKGDVQASVERLFVEMTKPGGGTDGSPDLVWIEAQGMYLPSRRTKPEMWSAGADILKDT